ncbi:unnamed protein product [Discosporangium mesarthrocarpum]
MIRGLSGGQKRRLSFATEMMGDPKIVFADEPTSGLDSHMALMLVSKMKGIVDRGKLVVATIHQPSSQVFGLFTHLHLLVEGRTVYFGPQTGVVNYLDQIGYPCPDFFNPADFFMSVLGRNTGHGRVAENLHLTGNQRNTAALSSTPTPTPTSTCESRVRSLLQAFEMSEEAATVLRGLPLENDLMNSLGAPKERTSNQPQTYQVSWIKQTAEVYLRTVKVIVRSELWKIFMSVALGAFFGLLFFHLGTSQEDVQGIMGFLFFALMTIGNRSFFTTAQVFTLETRHLLHEYDSGLYSMSAYFVGRTLAELPVQILFPTIFTTITGILTQVTRSTTTFLLYLLITILLENAYASIGYLVSSFCKNVGVAYATSQFISMPLSITGGLLLNTETLPVFLQWLPSVSPLHHAYSAISVVIWKELGSSLVCPDKPEGCRFPDDNAVLEYLHFEDTKVVINIIWLVSLPINLCSYAQVPMTVSSKQRKTVFCVGTCVCCVV